MRGSIYSVDWVLTWFKDNTGNHVLWTIPFVLRFWISYTVIYMWLVISWSLNQVTTVDCHPYMSWPLLYSSLSLDITVSPTLYCTYHYTSSSQVLYRVRMCTCVLCNRWLYNIYRTGTPWLWVRCSPSIQTCHTLLWSGDQRMPPGSAVLGEEEWGRGRGWIWVDGGGREEGSEEERWKRRR